jgi:hypothetical protein
MPDDPSMRHEADIPGSSPIFAEDPDADLRGMRQDVRMALAHRPTGAMCGPPRKRHYMHTD